MISIDGSAGAGGGQVVRTACALALVTGQPVTITDIRARRAPPGLLRRHVTAIEAALAVGGGSCDGLTVGASQICFRPGRVRAGDYRFALGTGGSTALVLQTILPALMLAEAPSRVTLDGGTHGASAPPFDFLVRVFLPILNRMGPEIGARLVRHGFYPTGGGRIEIEIVPAPLTPIACVDRGALLHRTATALFTGLPFDIADREIRAARAALDWPDPAFAVRELPEDQGPGNILLLEAGFEQVTEIVCGFGQFGVPAETLAKAAAARMAGYLASPAFAGPYLADQLLLPFALAGGGRFTTVKPGPHAMTTAAILEQFLARRCRFAHLAPGVHEVVVS